MKATLSIERELHNEFSIIDYTKGNGEFHFHSQIEVCIVNSGKLDALVDNKIKVLQKDDIGVSLSYVPHAFLPTGNADFTVLIIPANICENFVLATHFKKTTSPFLSNPSVAKTIRKYLEELKTENINDTKKLGYIYLILGTIMDNLSFEPTSNDSSYELIQKLLLYIQENYKKDISLASISKDLGYNASYISRYFKNCLSISINQYINTIRLKKALDLIKSKKHSITYCALESGFNSLRTFYRVFYKEFNISPGDYIKNITNP